MNAVHFYLTAIDHRLACVSDCGLIKIWDSVTGQCLGELQGHKGITQSLKLLSISTNCSVLYPDSKNRSDDQLNMQVKKEAAKNIRFLYREYSPYSLDTNVTSYTELFTIDDISLTESELAVSKGMRFQPANNPEERYKYAKLLSECRIACLAKHKKDIEIRTAR